MVIFVLLLAIFFLIIANVASHPDKEIQRQENERNNIKLLLAESKIKEADAFKNALGVSKKIVNWNDTFNIDSFNTNSIELRSSGIPEIRLVIVWRMADYKLIISTTISSKERIEKCSFNNHINFYNKSESEIINELKIIFNEIQNEFHLNRFINLY
jgi:hypothetical protein